MTIWRSICWGKSKASQSELTEGDKFSPTYIQYKYPTLTSSNGCNNSLKDEHKKMGNGHGQGHQNGSGGYGTIEHKGGMCSTWNDYGTLNGSVKKRSDNRKKSNKDRIQCGRAIIELIKRDEGNFGITISAPSKQKRRIRIVSIKPGSPAHRSDVLEVGDCIVSVNGNKITKPRPAYVAELLRQSGNNVQIEIEYHLPDFYNKQQFLTRGTFFVKNVSVKLKKDDNSSFGFNIRGGLQPDKIVPWPVVITKVRNGGPADREGSIKPGDRLILIDNINIINATLTETLSLMKHCADEAIFTIEYDTIYYDKIQNSKPFLLEIEKPIGISLGISMFVHRHGTKSYVCISGIKPASIADRCGALKPNDAILIIDDMSTNGMTVAEANRLIKYNSASLDNIIKLEVLKNFSSFCNSDLNIWSNGVSGNSLKDDSFITAGRNMLHADKSAASLNSERTESSLGSLPCFPYPTKLPPMISTHRPNGKKRSNKGKTCDSEASYSSLSTILVPSYQVCHSETTEVVLRIDSHGLGLALQNSNPKESDRTFYTFVSGMEIDSVAEKSGIIQIGDRVQCVNGESVDSIYAQRVVEMISNSPPGSLPHTDPSKRYCALKIEFDVAESIVPTSGIFLIQIAKKGSPDLGITLMAPKKRKLGEPLIISHIKKGSPAYRLGTIQPGDKFIAVDNISVLYHTLQEAMDILRTSNDLIKLKIQKDDTFSDEYDTLTNSVVYSVEVSKNGGPLGLALSGSEEPFDNPIIVSAITAGGIIDKTGAIHVGDKLLAINGESLRGKSLNDALLMLDACGDSVILKISKNKALEPINDNETYGTRYERFQRRYDTYEKLFMENCLYQSHHMNHRFENGQWLPKKSGACYDHVVNNATKGVSCLPSPFNNGNYGGAGDKFCGPNYRSHLGSCAVVGNISSSRDKRNGMVWEDGMGRGGDDVIRGNRLRDRENDLTAMVPEMGDIETADNTPVQSVDSAVESLDSSGGEANSPPVANTDEGKRGSSYPSPPPLLLYDATAATSIIAPQRHNSCGCDHGSVMRNGQGAPHQHPPMLNNNQYTQNNNLYHHCRKYKRLTPNRPPNPEDTYNCDAKGHQFKVSNIISSSSQAYKCKSPTHNESKLTTTINEKLDVRTHNTLTKDNVISPLPLRLQRFNCRRASSPGPLYSQIRVHNNDAFKNCRGDSPTSSTDKIPTTPMKLKKCPNYSKTDKGALSIVIPDNNLSAKLYDSRSQVGTSETNHHQTPERSNVLRGGNRKTPTNIKASRIMSDEWSKLLQNLDNYGESELLKHIEDAILGEGRPKLSCEIYAKPHKMAGQEAKKFSEIMTANLNPWYLRNGPRLLGLREDTRPESSNNKYDSKSSSLTNAFHILYKVRLRRELFGKKFTIEISHHNDKPGLIIASVREIATIGKACYTFTDMDVQSFRMLRPFDQILQINGISTTGMSWVKAIEQIESTILPYLELMLGRENSGNNGYPNPKVSSLSNKLANLLTRKYVLTADKAVSTNRPTGVEECLGSQLSVKGSIVNNKGGVDEKNDITEANNKGRIVDCSDGPNPIEDKFKTTLNLPKYFNGDERETSTSTLNTVIYAAPDKSECRKVTTTSSNILVATCRMNVRNEGGDEYEDTVINNTL